MKKILLTLTLLTSFSLLAQVGIGTINPETDFHVVGSVLIQTEVSRETLTTVDPLEEDFKLVTRSTNSEPVGELSILNVETLTVAPINTINYHITNVSLDNVTDLDLQYDASKYVIAVSNFRHVGDAIKKVINPGDDDVGHFVVHTFVDNGTWHLEIRNRSLDLDPADSLEYYVTLVVYDKSFYRHLDPIVTELNGNNTGTASSVPNLY
jgi:hypothetical protein